MIFTETKLKGLWVIEPQPHADTRGFFARMICGREFAEHGLQNVWPQQNIAFNHCRGTLRGMHYQRGDAAVHMAVFMMWLLICVQIHQPIYSGSVKN